MANKRNPERNVFCIRHTHTHTMSTLETHFVAEVVFNAFFSLSLSLQLPISLCVSRWNKKCADDGSNGGSGGGRGRRCLNKIPDFMQICFNFKFFIVFIAVFHRFSSTFHRRVKTILIVYEMRFIST